jgi:hypothetical protein
LASGIGSTKNAFSRQPTGAPYTARIAFLGLHFFTSLPDMSNVSSALNGLQGGLDRISFVAA